MQRLQSVNSEEELKALLDEHPELLPVLQQMVQQADDSSENTPVEQAVLDFLNADTWNDSKRIVEKIATSCSLTRPTNSSAN